MSKPPSLSPVKKRGRIDSPDDPCARILRWKDGKRAAFMLEFDDSAPTHLEFVIPALKNRGIPGTFYINPGNGPYRGHRSNWEREAASPGIELANHTFSHIGGSTSAEFEREIVLANEVIDRLYPARPLRRLRTWARPGVPPEQWGIAEAAIQAVLARHLMVERPPFVGPPFSIRTVNDMLGWVDGAVESGELRHLVFHGVGGDWHAAPLPYFFALLDKLESLATDLWLTDPLSAHKYAEERDTAIVGRLDSPAGIIRLSLSSRLDPALYDQPLSLETRVPSRWKRVVVVQDGRRQIRHANGGLVIFEAIPGGGPVELKG